MSAGCPLPSLAQLLAHATVDGSDAFILVVQIQTPAAFRPETADHGFLPLALLAALEGSLDNENTGDVKVLLRSSSLSCFCWADGRGARGGQFITRERQYEPEPDGTDLRDSSPSSSSIASTSVRPLVQYRKRVIFAHSDILRSCDYVRMPALPPSPSLSLF